MFGSLPHAEEVEPAVGRATSGALRSSTVAGAISTDVAMPGGGSFATGGFVQRSGAWWSAMENSPGVLDKPSSIQEVSDLFKQWEDSRHKEQVDYYAEQLPTPEVSSFADMKSAVAGLEDWGRKDFDQWVSNMHFEARSPVLATNRDHTFQGIDLHSNPLLDPAHKPEDREEHHAHLQVRSAASDILASLEQINTEDGRERQQLATVREACGALHEGLAEEIAGSLSPRSEARRVAKPLPRNARLLEWAAREEPAPVPAAPPAPAAPPPKKEGHAGIRSAATEAKLLLELATTQETGMLGSKIRRVVEEREEAEKEESERLARELKLAKEAEEKNAENVQTGGKKKKSNKKLSRMKHKTALSGRLGDSVSSNDHGEESSSSAPGTESYQSRSAEDSNWGRSSRCRHYIDYYAVLIQMSQVCQQSKQAVFDADRDAKMAEANVSEMESEVDELRHKADVLWERIRELELAGGVRIKQAKDPFYSVPSYPDDVARKPHARSLGEAQAVVISKRSLRTADALDSQDHPAAWSQEGDPRAGATAGRRKRNTSLPLDVGLLTNLSDADGGVGSWARF